MEQPEIDASQPTVNHQLRFHDGRRVNATFNTNSSMASVFAYARRMSNSRGIRILVGHPPTEVHEGQNLGILWIGQGECVAHQTHSIKNSCIGFDLMSALLVDLCCVMLSHAH